MKKLITFIALAFIINVSAQDNWKLKSDKQLHLLGGAGVGYVVTDVAMGLDKFNDRDAIALGLILGYSVGAGKEVYDLYSKKGTASLQDLTYTFTGVIVGTLASYGINKLIDRRNKKRVKL